MAHYEAVQKVMVAAGIDEPGGGSGGAFRLRHTFALRQLRRNRGVEDVARWMGIANIEEMQRYTGVLYGYAEPV
jgi:site-specific recombinase XerD